MKIHAAVLSTLLFTWPCSSEAQPAEPIEVGERQEIAESVSQLMEAVEPLLTEQGEKKSAAKEAFSLRPMIEKELTWSKQPRYLIEVPVEKEANTGKTRVMGGLRTLGSGKDDASILCADYSIDHNSSAASSGFRYSPEDSFFLEASTSSAKGKVIFRILVVPPPGAAKIRTQAVAYLADSSLKGAILEARQGALLDGIIQYLGEQKAHSSQNAATVAALQKLKASKARLDKADKDLAIEIQKAKSAQDFLKQISGIQAILTLATMAAQARAAMPDASPKEISALPDKNAIMGYTQTYVQKKDGIITTYKKQIIIDQKAIESDRGSASTQLQKSGAPNTIINQL